MRGSDGLNLSLRYFTVFSVFGAYCVQVCRRVATVSSGQRSDELFELGPCIAFFRAFDDAVDFGAGFERVE